MKTGRGYGRLMTGATLVEFLIVSPMIVLLILGLVQGAFFFIAKTQVNYAVDFAARYAATRNGSVWIIRKGLSIGLLSLQGGSSSPGAADLAMRHAKLTLAMNNPLDPLLSIQRLNPTPECFSDWAAKAGNRVIPNAHLNFRPRVPGAKSRLSLQDCNILKIRVVYGYKPVTPLIRQVLMKTLTALYPLNTFYARDRIPIEAMAIVHMQSDVAQ